MYSFPRPILCRGETADFTPFLRNFHTFARYPKTEATGSKNKRFSNNLEDILGLSIMVREAGKSPLRGGISRQKKKSQWVFVVFCLCDSEQSLDLIRKSLGQPRGQL